MANFTVELRSLVEEGEDVGLNDYPIFDEEYRDTLNSKIINHFYFNEIAHETPMIFAQRMRTKMGEIMPYYNKLYLSEQYNYSPFITTRMVTSSTTKGTNVTDNTTNSTTDNASQNTSKARSVASEFPQTRLGGNEDYATAANDTASESSSGGSSSGSVRSSTAGKADASNDSTVEGFTGDMASLLTNYRASLLNIDLLVIGELETLFMGVWNNNAEYSMGWRTMDPFSAF